MQRLTLCMIVRNEERFLEGCLESVRGLVDALVVVDTGSTDGTLAIARRHGAKVIEHAWNDDFAAARNAALAHVSSGFVLVLDADERLAPGAARELRKALARDDFDCGLLPLHDAASLDARPEEVVAGRARRGEPVLLPRLLRRTPDLAWEGVVHEQVGAWARRGRRIATVQAPLVHYGAVPQLRDARGKNERNLKLLERRVELEPDNPTVLAYLARELERAGRSSAALETARRGWRALRAAAATGRSTGDVVLPVTLLGFLALRAGLLDEALSALHEARSWSEPHPNLDLLEGLAHERRALRAADIESFAAELDAAHHAYVALRGHRGQGFTAEVLPGALGAVGATRLGTVLLLRGAVDEARLAFEEALGFDPQALEARLGRAEAWIEGGRIQEALDALPDLTSSGSPDAWLLGAAAAAALGCADDVEVLAGRARAALSTNAWVADFRLGRLEELERALAPAQRPLAPPAEVRDVPRASVVIPAYNRLDLLRPVLEGFRRQRDGGEFELIVADDGSQPPVRELFDTLGAPPSWRLCVHERNRGRAAALNTAIAVASGDVVIVCDSDIEPGERFVAEHLALHVAANDERATFLGALEYGVDAGLFGAWMGARSNPRLRGGARRVDWTQWFTDNWSFRRPLLATRGLRFDERYRAWGWEELDLAFELESLGATNSLVETARGRHLKAASFEGLFASFARSAPNLLLLASKRPASLAVRDWLATRGASPEVVERAASAARRLWERVERLDELAPSLVRAVDAPGTGPIVLACATACSDLLFRVGLAQGCLEHAPDPVGAVAEASHASANARLAAEVESAARALARLDALVLEAVPSLTRSEAPSPSRGAALRRG